MPVPHDLFPTQFCVQLTRAQVAALAVIAQQESTSRAAIVRRLLNHGLRDHDRVTQIRAQQQRRGIRLPAKAFTGA